MVCFCKFSDVFSVNLVIRFLYSRSDVFSVSYDQLTGIIKLDL